MLTYTGVRNFEKAVRFLAHPTENKHRMGYEAQLA